jgi:hypothetical protein
MSRALQLSRRGLAEQDFSGGACARDPRREVDGGADVIARAVDRTSRVKPDVERRDVAVRCGCVARCCGECGRVIGVAEGEHEAIAELLDQLAVVL